MKRRTIIIGAVAATAVLVGGGVGIAQAQRGDDDGGETETPIPGAYLERASAAALAETGGGRVTETEVGDEESYYEVEVTLDDGSQVECNSTTSSRSSARRQTSKRPAIPTDDGGRAVCGAIEARADLPPLMMRGLGGSHPG